MEIVWAGFWLGRSAGEFWAAQRKYVTADCEEGEPDRLPGLNILLFILNVHLLLDGVHLQDPGGGGGDPHQGEGVSTLPARLASRPNCFPPAPQYFQVITYFIFQNDTKHIFIRLNNFKCLKIGWIYYWIIFSITPPQILCPKSKTTGWINLVTLSNHLFQALSVLPLHQWARWFGWTENIMRIYRMGGIKVKENLKTYVNSTQRKETSWRWLTPRCSLSPWFPPSSSLFSTPSGLEIGKLLRDISPFWNMGILSHYCTFYSSRKDG